MKNIVVFPAQFKFLVILIFWIALGSTSSACCLTVSSYHIMCLFQIEFPLYSCLNVKELLARSRREIWSLSDCNWTRHLVHKRTLNHLVKQPVWLNGWVFVCELSGCGFEYSCSHLGLLFIWICRSYLIIFFEIRVV